MIDLSKLSDDDFKALQAGNLSAMSDAGFGLVLKMQQASLSNHEKAQQQQAITREQTDPTKGMGAGGLIAAGAGKAVADLGQGMGQMVGLTDRADVDATRERDKPLMATGGGKGGYFVGSLATSVPGMMAPGANTVVGAGLIGGLQGLLQPVGSEDVSPAMDGYGLGDLAARLKNAGISGGVGAASTLGGNALSRIISPKPAEGVSILINAGVKMTPGQRLGGAWKRAEDGATSIPFAGDMIRSAQRRAVGDFDTVVANKALSHVNARLPADTFGNEAVKFTERTIGDAYESVLKQVQTVQKDSQFANELATLQGMVRTSPLPKEVKGQFDSVIKNQITGKFQGQNTMTAQTYKDAESELGRLASKYQADPSADKQLLGDALQEAQAALRTLLERSAGPGLAKDAKAANAAWAEFKRMQRASTFLGAEDGIFTPENYLNAVKALDRSKDKGAFARGDALGQELAQDAVRVLGRKVPDSGTPFRTMMAEPLKGVTSAILSAPLTAAYSKTGQNVLRALLTDKRPPGAKLLASELEMIAPYLGITSGSAALANLAGQ